MDNLLSIEFDSVAFGWKFVNELDDGQVQVLEATPLGKGCFWLFLTGEFSALEKVHQRSVVSGKKSVLLQSVDTQVKSALYSLQREKLQSFLGVVEAESVSDALEIGHHLHRQGCQLVEILNGRGLGGLAIVYFTGESPELAEQAAEHEKVSHFEIISPVTGRLADYFRFA